MSDKPSNWQERTGLMANLRRPAPAPPPPAAAPAISGPELVVNHETGETDPFADRREYEAVRSIFGRSHDACFLADDGMPYFKPWAYFQGAEAHPAHRGLTLHWPGTRIEVKGENLKEVYLRVMTRRADVWRVFDAARHDAPKSGGPVIRSIRVVVEGDQADDAR